MNAVAGTILQLKDRPPLPQPAEYIDVGAGGWLDNRNALLLAHLEFLGEFLDFCLVVRRRDAIGLLVQVLLANEMPGDHESKHE